MSGSQTRDRLMERLRKAFDDYGYERVTMGTLADACEVTRRTLYNHFHNKEDAFRGMLQWLHVREVADGLAAGRGVMEAGGSVLDAMVAVMDARYAVTRRRLETSPHAIELNYTAFRRFNDVISASAVSFQAEMTLFVEELIAGGRLRLRPGITPAELTQLLADGARGVNQSLPAKPAAGLPGRYRVMFAVILRGATEDSGP